MLEIELPRGFRNVGITLSNHLVADTNDSSNWDTIRFPLPRGRWVIKSYVGEKTVVLVDKSWIGRLKRFLNS